MLRNIGYGLQIFDSIEQNDYYNRNFQIFSQICDFFQEELLKLEAFEVFQVRQVSFICF